MTKLPFELPDLNAPTPSPQCASDDVKSFIATRRSTPIKTFDAEAPGPSGEELENMLAAAMRVPDHRRLGPWRAIIVRQESRETLGAHLARRFKDLNPEASEQEVEIERQRLLRAPVSVIIVSSPKDDGKTPVWEQELSAGALCMNLLYVTHACGYAGSWLTEWWAFDAEINTVLGLSETERIAGNVFIGQSKVSLFERPRPSTSERISVWSDR